MKSALSMSVLVVGAMFLGKADAATYAGQACESRTSGVSLSYVSSGARNLSGAPMSITCPLTRNNDLNVAAATAVAYFVNDGQSKTCFFDNFNIDTGGLGIWTSGSATGRLQLPTIATTLRYQPFTLNCSLPAGSQVNGYYLGE